MPQCVHVLRAFITPRSLFVFSTPSQVLSGHGYYGEQADIWSLGVVLFAMMCGYLPFDSDDADELRRIIDTASYEEPKFLSMDCRSLIRALLQTNPEDRPSIEQILDHPWLQECRGRDVLSVSDQTLDDMLQDPLGQASLGELAMYYGVPSSTIAQLLKLQLYDHLHADFELLLQAKTRKMQVHLPAGGGRLENLGLLALPAPHPSSTAPAASAESAADEGAGVAMRSAGEVSETETETETECTLACSYSDHASIHPCWLHSLAQAQPVTGS
jgi:serine/threonine protein kinase